MHQRLGTRAPIAIGKQPLHDPVGSPRIGEDLCDERGDGVIELSVWDTTVNQTDLSSLSRAHTPAREHELLRRRPANPLRQSHRHAPNRRQPPLAVRVTELGRIRRDQQVTSQRKLEPPRETVPVQPSDCRLRKVLERVNGLGLEMGARGTFSAGYRIEIVTGAKGSAGALKNDTPDLAVTGNRVQMRAKTNENTRRERVQLLRPVQRQSRQTLRIGSDHKWIAHERAMSFQHSVTGARMLTTHDESSALSGNDEPPTTGTRADMLDTAMTSDTPPANSVETQASAHLDDWIAEFGEFVIEHRFDEAAAVIEVEALDLLAKGKLERLEACLARIPSNARTPTLRVAACDAAVRTQKSNLKEIEQVERFLASEKPKNASVAALEPWLAAVKAEHFVWHGDLIALAIAEHTLASLGDDLLPPTPILVARGRLRGIQAIGRIFAFDPDAIGIGEATLNEALRDLDRAGWEEQRTLIGALFAFSRCAASWDDPRRARRVLEEASDRLRALDSDYAALALVGLALVSFLEGDMWRVHRALDAIEAAPATPIVGVPPLVAYVRAMCALVADGPEPDALCQASEAADAFRTGFVQAMSNLAGSVASVLADWGAAGAAREWLGRVELSQSILPYAHLDRSVVSARIAILEGDPEAVVRLRETTDTMRSIGLERLAACNLLRAARDAERAGNPQATALRSEALEALPDSSEWTLWEWIWSQPLDADSARIGPGIRAAGTAHRIQACGAFVEITRDGKRIDAPPSVARLMAVLAAERESSTVDRVADALWGEIDLKSARTRLNTLIHRARAVLGVDRDELIVRSGDTVSLVLGDDWACDVRAWREMARGSDDEKLTAFTDYSELASAQFAYDDAVADARRDLRNEWVALTIALLRAGRIPDQAVADAITRVGIDDPEAIMQLADALRDVGRRGEADNIESRLL